MWRYLVVMLSVAMSSLALVLLANVLFDPFWIFGRTVRLTEKKYAFDERVQKTNLILNGGITFEGVLIGSSRTTYIDSRSFEKNRYFNYAVGHIFATEYPELVDAASIAGTLRAVTFGLDFYASNGNHPHHHFKPIEYYVENARREKFASLLSIDGIGYAWKTITCTEFSACSEYYDRDFVKHMKEPPSRRERDAKILRQLGIYDDVLYGKGYEWDEKYEEYLETLKRKHPDVGLTAFTTPTSYPLFSLLVKKGRLLEYEKWLRISVKEFGGVWDFMGVNSVTTNLDNYVDAHHFLPYIGVMIANRIEGRGENVPQDFGVLVTNQNIDQHLESIREQAKRVDPDPIATYMKRQALEAHVSGIVETSPSYAY